MKKFIGCLLSLSLILAVSGCNKEKLEDIYNVTEYHRVHQLTDWDSKSITNQLAGKWKLEYIWCCAEGRDQKGVLTDKNQIIVEFLDSVVHIYESGNLTQTSNWIVDVVDGDAFGIQTAPNISYLFGRIFFKNQQMVCNGSYIDLGDHFFRKLTED